MTVHVISSGATSGFDLLSGDELKVDAGGESDASVVSGGAHEYISSGGLSEADTLLSAGIMTLFTGATADDLTVSSGATVIAGVGALTGYDIVAGLISSGAIGTVDGTDFGLVAGDLEIASGGRAIGTQVVNGVLSIDAGATATSAVLVSSLLSLDSIAVASGGEAYGTLASGGSEITVYGVASRTILLGAQIDVYGSSLSTVVSSASLEIVYSGGVADADQVASGGAILLFSGATAESVRVSSGAALTLAVEVRSGQRLTVQAGPIAEELIVNSVAALPGAIVSALDPVVDSGGVLVLQSGASVSNVTVSAGGSLSGGIISGGAYSFDLNTDAGYVSGATLTGTPDGVASIEPGELQVADGGSSYRVTVGIDGLLEVESGGSASLTSVTGTSGLLQVDSGGLASLTSVTGTSALLQVDAGGRVSGSLIGGSSGSGQSALILGSASNDTVSSGGYEEVGSGGVASRSIVSSGGAQAVGSGGSALATFVLSGGLEMLGEGAYASGVTVSSGATIDLSIALSSGQEYDIPPASGTSTVALDGVDVLAGATLNFDQATLATSVKLSLEGHTLTGGAVIAAGAKLVGPGSLLGETIDAGEVESLTLGQSGATGSDLQVTAGGLVRFTSVLGAGVEVSSGGEAENLTLGSGALATVAAGAHFLSGVIDSGAELVVQSGVTATGTIVSSGGTVDIVGARVISGATLSAGPAVGAPSVVSGVTVLVGGVTDYARLTVSAGAQFDLDGGGVVAGATILSGGLISGTGLFTGQTINSGSLSGVSLAGYVDDIRRMVDTTVGSGGFVRVEAGALSYSAALSETGSQLVLSGGLASRSVISSGGSETVLAGGSAFGETISAGGVQLVSSGGLVSGAIVRSGGVETLRYGATAQAVTVSSGATISVTPIVSSGQTVIIPGPGGATTIGGVTVQSGGTVDAFDTAVRSGGTVSVASGAALSNAVVEAGGRLVGGGSVESVADLGNDYSPESPTIVQGLVSGVTVGRDTDTNLEILAGGTAENVTLENGGIILSSGASASGVRLDPNGGYQFFTVEVGAAETGAVLGRGDESLEGASTSATVESTALQQVGSNGLAVAAVVSSNAQQWLLDGAFASATTVLSGGELLMDLGATAVGAHVSSGAALDVGEGGADIASGQTLSAGRVSAAVIRGGVIVSSGAAVIYDDLVLQSGATVVFGSQGALGDVTIQSGAVVSGSGTLFDAVAVYGEIKGLTIGADPFFAADPSISANLPYDYHQSSGTQFIEAGGVGSSVQIVSGGYLNVAAGGDLNTFVLSSGGYLTVQGGGSALSGRVLAGAFEEAVGGATLSGTVVSSGGELQDDGEATAAAGQTLYQGLQPAPISIDGALVSSGGVLHYSDVVVDSGGALSVGAPALTFLQLYYDSLTVSHGGLVSGLGELGGYTSDAGVVSGVIIGNPMAISAAAPVGTLEISSGGLGKAVTVALRGTVGVDAGGVISASQVSGAEIVSSGGSDIAGVVVSGGSATFQLGAKAQGVTVSSGGEAILAVAISSGQVFDLATNHASAAQVLSGVNIQSGGVLQLQEAIVSSGGVLSLGAAASAGDLTVSAGGVVSGGTLSSLYNPDNVTGVLGMNVVDGLAEDTTIVGNTQVTSGGVGRDLILTDGGLDLASGALVSGIDVTPGATDTIVVESGAVLSNAVLEAGGEGDAITVNGSANGDTIDSGGTETVAFGTDTDALVTSGGALVLGYEGTVSGATVLSGGLFFYDDDEGGQAEGVTVSSGGRIQFATYVYVDQGQTLVDGALTTSTTSEGVALQVGAIIDYSGEVADGGTLSVTSVGQAQTIDVDSGGLLSGQGGLAQGGQNLGTIDGVSLSGQLADSGVTSDVVIASGGIDDLFGPAKARYGRILSGGAQVVYSGAAVTGEVISAGGSEALSSGGVLSDVSVLSGGSAMIFSGGVVSSLTVSSGGSATIQAIVSSGQTDVLSAPGAATADTFGQITVAAGGTLTLQSAGVQAGGHLVLGSGVVVSSGAYIVTISTGPYEITTYQVNAGVTVSSGGTLSGPGAIAGVLTVSSGGSASGVSVLFGGTDMIASGAVETNVSVASGASLVLTGAVISSGHVAQDGVTTAAEVLGGASAAIGTTVTLSGATVSSGGSLQVLGRGSASDVLTIAGGALVDNGAISYDGSSAVTLAGTLSGAGALTLAGSSTVLVQSGSASGFTGAVTLSTAYNYDNSTGEYDVVSGTLELANASGLGSGSVVYDTYASLERFSTLQVDASDTPANGATFASPLENFNDSGDALDLRGLAYVSGASASTSAGMLTLTDGSRTAKFTLTGQYASGFTVASDGHGGTLVTPSAAAGSEALRQAVAAFTGPSSAELTTPTRHDSARLDTLAVNGVHYEPGLGRLAQA